MAESILDIEQAPAIPVRVEKTQLSNSNLEADEAKPENVEAEKVVILSFRSLQLRRIAELQDELLRLSGLIATGKTATGTPPSDDHKSTVDCALRNYGKFLSTFTVFWMSSTPKTSLTHSNSGSNTKLRDSIAQCSTYNPGWI
jgi:hypothetical protein